VFKGRPISIVSGFRDPTYNKACGGALQSQHLSGKAADFSVNNLPPFDHPDPVIATVSNIDTLTLNAAPQQITSQRSIGVEVSRDGAAPAFVTVTVNANNTTA